MICPNETYECAGMELVRNRRDELTVLGRNEAVKLMLEKFSPQISTASTAKTEMDVREWIAHSFIHSCIQQIVQRVSH